MTQNSTVEYAYRKNMGNYEHAELKITGTFKGKEDRLEVVSDLIEFVGQALDHSGPFAKKEGEVKAKVKVETKTNPREKEVEETATTTKTETTTATTAKGEKRENKGKQEESNEKDDKASSEKSEGKGEQKAESKSDGKKRGINKNTKYDRKLDAHRNLFGSFLDEARPNWRDKDTIKKASEVSAKLHEEGVDFLDANGDILDSFKERFLGDLDAALEAK